MRLPSLNALDQTRGRPLGRPWLGAPLPSADTIGRILTQVDLEHLRQCLYRLYRMARRKKALRCGPQRVLGRIVDGHESRTSYRRRCDGCLERRLGTSAGERIQYDHRHVLACLRADGQIFLLDIEPIANGEGEVAAAMHLVTWLLQHVPRA